MRSKRVTGPVHMSIRNRIWLLPLIAILVSILSVGANYRISSSASKLLAQAGSHDYELVNTSSALIAQVEGVEETLKSAVAAGDKQVLETLDAKAAAFHSLGARLAQVPDEAARAATLTTQFEAYLRASKSAAA